MKFSNSSSMCCSASQSRSVRHRAKRMTRAGRDAALRTAASRAMVPESLEARQLFTLIGLSLGTTYPNIVSQGPPGQISYDSSTHVFNETATNIALLQSSTTTDPITPNTTSDSNLSTVLISVDNLGNLLGGAGPSGNDIDIEGMVTVTNGATTTTYNGTLLTGSIQQFGYEFDNGFPLSTAEFDFIFKPTGGQLESYFGGGQLIGMTSSAISTSTFPDQPFSTDFTLQAPKSNVAPIPSGIPMLSTPSIATTPNPTTVTLGPTTTTLTDSADLTGGSTSPGPTGSITFDLYYNGGSTPVDAETVSVSGDGVYTTPLGYTLPTSGAVTGLYQWDATYSGDSNNAPVSESNNTSEQVTVLPAAPTINTVQQPATALVGSTVADTATVRGGYNPTGTVTFNLYNNPSGTGTPLFTNTEPLVGGVATSGGYTATATGTDYWVATYSGDSNNQPVTSSPTSEPVTITPTTPSINTVQKPATAIVGSSVADTATVSGGYNPTGTVTFNLYNNSSGTGTPLFTDANEPLVGGTATSKGYTATVTGTDYWVAVYSGDSNNVSVTSSPTSEPVVITPNTPSITTSQQPTTAVVGSSVADMATVSGLVNASSGDTVTFNLYSSGTVQNSTTLLFSNTQTVSISGGTATATSAGYSAGATGTDYWVATFNGDSNNTSVTSGATAEPVTITPHTPSITTSQQPTTAVVGSSVADMATVTGLVNASSGDTVTFNLYSSATTQNSTTLLFSNTQTVSLSGGTATATSAGYSAGATGTDYWVATFNGDNNNSKVTSGATAEPVTITPHTPSITTTQQPASAVVGSSIADKATVTGLVNAGTTDTVTFNLYSSGTVQNSTTLLYSNTQTVTISGGTGTATSAGYTAGATGTDYWVATFNGDTNNSAVTSSPTAEPVSITPGSPSINTTPSLTTVTLGTTTVNLKDTAVLSGGSSPTGTITFTLVSPSNTIVDTETVTVSGDNSYTTPTGYTLPTNVAVTGTYQWNATYSGDSKNSSVSENGSTAEQVVVSPAPPTITTTPSVTTTTGTCGCYGTIGYWNCKSGQSCISTCSTKIGAWCAANCSNLFGCSNQYTCGGLSNCGGATSWGGLSNSQCANLYNSFCTPSGLHDNTYVQACGLAFGLCASGGNGGCYNIGSNGAAFGCANNTVLTCAQILQCVNNCFSSSTGQFCGGNTTLCQQLNNVLCGINCSGSFPTCGAVCGGTETLNDTATIAGGYYETGSVTFYLFAPGVTPNSTDSNAVYTDTVTVSGNGTYSTATQGNHPGGYVATQTGTYQWVAVYSGDSNNKGVTSPYGSEPQPVGQQCPSIFSTSPNCTSITLGNGSATLSDSADLEEGMNPTGTITWTLYLNGGSTPVFTTSDTVNGNGVYTSGAYTLPTTGNVTGTYQWDATYSGDANNIGDTDTNNPGERTVVSPACTTITTSPSPSSVSLSTSSVVLKDTATLAGGYYPTGSITFTLVAPGGSTVDTETVSVSGDGSYTTPTGYTLAASTASGTYQWNATYTSGNGNNQNSSDINDCNEQVSVKGAAKGSICGYVFCDDNLDGLFDSTCQSGTTSTETGEAGATITLSQGSTVIATTTSGTSGYYSFTSLPLGTYTVSITGFSPNHQAEQSHGSVKLSTSATVTLTASSPTACGPAEGQQGSGMNNSLDFAEIAPGGLEGFVWDDANNDGNIDYNEAGIINVTITLNGVTYTGQSVSQTAVTDSDGQYVFSNLLPGTYTMTESTPSGFTDGKDMVGSLGGSECYSSNCTSSSGCSSGSSCYNDCYSDYGYNCFVSVITNWLNGGCSNNCNYCGGNSNYCGGQYSCGWNSGGCSAQNTFSCIQIGGCEDVGVGYNFGETGGTLSGCSTNTATLAFWHNSQGQALLCSLNGGQNSTALGNWLATMYPNIYGSSAKFDFAGMTNVQIAAFYNSNDFNVSGIKLNAAVLSAALSCYVTNSTWAGGTYAAKYGFTVTAQGVGYDTINVGSNGSAFGVSNNSSITILQALDATNQQAVDGLLYDGNSSLMSEAYAVYAAVAQNGQNT